MSVHDLKAAILACGVVDELGIAGTSGTSVAWSELDTTPPGTGKTLKAVFGKTDATFRRIDLPARALVLACEAAGIERVLTPAQRQDTAICVETDVGSLATDVDFQGSLDGEFVHAGIFPYSLTSTALGEVALRYKLRGQTQSVSVLEQSRGESLREALRLLAGDEVPFVLAGVADVLDKPAAGRPAQLRGIVTVLGPAGTEGSLGTLEWPAPGDDDGDATRDPFEPFVRMCR